MNPVEEALAVQIVKSAYVKLIGELSGQFRRIKPAKKNSKLWDNCVRVYNFCRKKHINVEEYMLVMNGVYGLDWAMKKFKTPYLPFTLITSERVNQEAYHTFPDQAQAVMDIKTMGAGYLYILQGIAKDTALELIATGFCGNIPELKNYLTMKTNER